MGIQRFLIMGGFVTALMLSGCGSSSGSDGGSGFVQLIHGIADAPALSVEILDGDDVVEAFSTLAFQGATSRVSLAQGSYEVEFFFEDPQSGFEERFLTTEVNVTSDTIFMGVLAGTFDDEQIIWQDRPVTESDTDNEEIEVVAVNLSATSVSIYLGDDDEGTATENLVATLAPGSVSTPTVLAYDDDADYIVRATEEGMTNLIYESDDVNILEDTRYTVVLTDSTGPDPATKSVFLVEDDGAVALANAVAQSGFILVNAVPDAATVDMVVEVSATGDILAEASLSYMENSPATTSDANFVDVQATASTDANVSYSTTVSLNEDTAYSFAIAGASLAEDVSVRANERDLRRVANAVNIHFINAITETDIEDSSAVDFYVLRLGDSISDTAPLGVDVEFLEGFSAIVGATPYDMVVTSGGTQSILAGPTRLFPEGGDRVIVVAGEAAGGGLPNQLTIVASE